MFSRGASKTRTVNHSGIALRPPASVRGAVHGFVGAPQRAGRPLVLRVIPPKRDGESADASIAHAYLSPPSGAEVISSPTLPDSVGLGIIAPLVAELGLIAQQLALDAPGRVNSLVRTRVRETLLLETPAAGQRN